MSLKTLTRANFRFLDNLPISQFILNFVRPHKTKIITDTIVYDSYVRKKTTGWFHGLDGEGRGKQMHCIMYRTADVACLPLATPKPFPSHSLQCQDLFFFKFCNQDVSSMTPSLQTRSLNEAVYRVIDRLVYITACLQRWTISLLEATYL